MSTRWQHLLAVRGRRFEEAMTTIVRRLVLLGTLVVTLYLVLAIRLISLGVDDLPQNTATAQPAIQAIEAYQQNIPPDDQRPDLVDRKGVLMATSTYTTDLGLHPKKLNVPADVAIAQIAETITGVDQQALTQRAQRGARYIKIRNSLTPNEVHAVRRLGLSGTAFVRRQVRIYPQGRLAAHVVGYVNDDGKGQAGLERSIDRRLVKPGADGAIRSTIDLRYQFIIRQNLLAAMRDQQPQTAVGLLLDLRARAIRAMVSLPDYNPNLVQLGQQQPTNNHATHSLYEPGSVFKIINTAMALELLQPDRSQTFNTSQRLQVDRFTIRDPYPKPYDMTLAEIFIRSSNIGSTLMALDVGAQKQEIFLRRVGIFTPPSIALSGEISAPLIPAWLGSQASTATIAYGYGLALSPLHLTGVIAGLIHAGQRIPFLLVDPRHRQILTDTPDPPYVSRSTVHRIRALMALNTTDGSGRLSAVRGYDVGSKTGTALKISTNGDRAYDRQRVRTSLIASIPAHDPRFVLMIMLDDPQPDRTDGNSPNAGVVVAPIVKTILRQIIALAGITGNNSQTSGPQQRLHDLMRAYRQTLHS